MRAYHKETVDNVVAYIASQYYKDTGKYIVQTLMYKILALFDFTCVRKFGIPCTELSYKALKMGPAPDELYNDRIEGQKYKTQYDETSFGGVKYYIAVKEADMDYVSEAEKEVLDNILKEFIENKINTKRASQITHERILAWKKTWKKNPNGVIDYGDEFDGIDKKDESEMSIPESNYYQYRMFSRV